MELCIQEPLQAKDVEEAMLKDKLANTKSASGNTRTWLIEAASYETLPHRLPPTASQSEGLLPS